MVASAFGLHSEDGKCRILCLKGGGMHGAYEVGAIKAFTDLMPPDEVKWDYISGVSVGSLVATWLGLFPYGQEKEAAADIYKHMPDLTPDRFWEFWPHKIIDPFHKMSAVNNEGWFSVMEEYFGDKPFQRKVSWQAVDANTGQVVVFDETVPLEVRNKAIIGSGSVPFAFPPQEIDGMMLIDGGIFANIALGDPIQRCKEEEGVEDKDIIMDVILCNVYYTSVPEWKDDDYKFMNAYNIHSRKTLI